MRVITDREVYSYAPGDEKPKKTREERRSERKQKIDKLEQNPLFQAGAAAAGQFLQTKYGPSQFNVTRDQEGNVSVGDVSGGNVPIIGETDQQKAEREKAEKRKKTVIAVSVVGGVIVLGIIAFMVYRNSSKSSKK